MGQSSKKKKKRGGNASGRKGKGRAPSKDHSLHVDGDLDLLSEELTALAAIFQEDFKIVSETPHTQFVITLRPYSNDTSSNTPTVSAHLLVRCLPGYPYKCPKLQVVPERGLSKDDTDRLLSLLIDQANSNAREGRVMIFNLVEAAQEFLSEVVPVQQSHESASCSGINKRENLVPGDAAVACDNTFSSRESFVYGLIDLFSDLCGDGRSWDGGFGSDSIHDSLGKFSEDQTIVRSRGRESSIQAHKLDAANIGFGASEKYFLQNAMPPIVQDKRNGSVARSAVKLAVLEEETDDDDTIISPKASNIAAVPELVGKSDVSVDRSIEDFFLVESTLKVDDCDSKGEPLDSLVSTSVAPDQTSRTKEKDLVMIHLLRLVCSLKGPVPHALPDIISELYNIGILSEGARDLATKQSLLFNRAFECFFRRHMAVHHPNGCSVPQFWKSSADFGEKNSSSAPSSRYLNDFEELCPLGHGGFGHVMLCKNKLDGRQYAVKRIRLRDKSLSVNDKILREVATLSRLQHQHVVRYYQAWFETGTNSYCGDAIWGSTVGSTSCSNMGTSLTNAIDNETKSESTYLYIQMEYCPRTLQQIFDSYTGLFDKELAWHLFRQIVEGLAHIHGQGIIHRDLTPSNIFFDARNDIKIGDFGLAKFLRLEQSDHDLFLPPEANEVPMDGTGQVGTYFYTAPEIEQEWPQIDEKVDMYSLGVVFFELWHPFGTAMERHAVLLDLKQKRALPASWVAEFPEQSCLQQRLMSPSPSDRPSAMELLQDALPPRMEDEWLNDILRTMQSAEDTYVYDRVVSTIFDEERFLTKAHRQHGGRGKLSDVSPIIQNAELEHHGRVIEVARDVFKQHGAKRLGVPLFHVLDDHQINRKVVKLLTRGGDMLELCHELRMPFVYWVVANQKLSFKRYEISWVYRRAVGHSAPSRYLQGDFDIIGGSPALTEAEILKVTMDILTRFFPSDAFDIRVNHAHVLDAIWSWIGIEGDTRLNVAKLVSLMGSSCPQSVGRKTRWVLIRRQLLQDLHLAEAVVNRLQTVDRRFCGPMDSVLARLRGALPPDKSSRNGLEELSTLFTYLRVWKIEKHVTIDALMPPVESYYRGIFFEIYMLKDTNHVSFSEGILLATGGRYDHLIDNMWDHEHKSSPPGAVGVSVALEKILHLTSAERNEASASVLICSRGGGGLLEERMELVAELWQANIKADLVPMPDPSLTEQFEYANEHDIKWLVILTETGLSQTGSVKVRHLEHKKELEIQSAQLIKFLAEATSTQFRKFSMSKVWN